MSTDITHIKRVEIKGLWGRQDFVWDLHPDVNILGGMNGGGKSTILNCIYNTLMSSEQGDLMKIPVNEINIFLNNDKKIFYERIRVEGTIEQIESLAQKDPKYKVFVERLKLHYGENYRSSHYGEYEYGITSLEDIKLSKGDLKKILNIDIIRTFDTRFKPSEAVKKLSDNNVETELDWMIYKLQDEYLEYQLNINKKIPLQAPNITEEIMKLRQPLFRFWEMLDTLFQETYKRVDREDNKISFHLGMETISPYILSSGEKQLLVILLTALVQDQKQSILLLDEPEISLHIDWQKKLIGYIRELNPNVQVILATHSPGLILEGWHDKVSEVSDLVDNK